jgi:[acyl-carrier-protein] S-malonyltransferase/trans-AT polyketide synthase/acyltransferase/oxidoreductase domain-containing protein
MQRAVPQGLGGMLAVSGPAVAHLVTAAKAARFDLDVSSVNSPDQVVLSGLISDLDRAESALTAEGYLLSRLEVSAPFHSRFMKTIEPALRRDLELTLRRWDCAPANRVVSNALATFHVPEPRAIVNALVRQVGSPVRWLENMTQLADAAERIVEIGPSRPLRGLFRSVGRHVDSITTLKTAEREMRA